MNKNKVTQITKYILLNLKEYCVKKQFFENVILIIILFLSVILITSLKISASKKLIIDEKVKIYTMLEGDYLSKNNEEKEDEDVKTSASSNKLIVNDSKNHLNDESKDINVNSSNFTKTYEIININVAVCDKLMKLPGIGESIAKAIIEYRDKNGSFKNIEDIKNVVGIGEKKFEKIKNYITV